MINIDDIKAGYTLGHADAEILRSMAKELEAYRKAFSEPAVWIDPQVIINFQCGEEIKEWAWAKKIDDTDIPLYRKPTIPE